VLDTHTHARTHTHTHKGALLFLFSPLYTGALCMGNYYLHRKLLFTLLFLFPPLFFPLFFRELAQADAGALCMGNYYLRRALLFTGNWHKADTGAVLRCMGNFYLQGNYYLQGTGTSRHWGGPSLPGCVR